MEQLIVPWTLPGRDWMQLDRAPEFLVGKMFEARIFATRTGGLLGCLFGALLWSLAPPISGAQNVEVEWMEFDCRDGRCLVLNAYPSEDLDAERNDNDERNLAGIDSGNIAPIFLSLPVTTAPDRSSLDSFLKLLGVGDLEELAQTAPRIAHEAPGSPRFDSWATFIRQIRSGHELQIGDLRVRGREVNGDLKRVYTAQGFPTRENPIFPHLVRGVLAVYDEDDTVADAIRILNLGAVAYGTSDYKTVTFVNLGSRPARIYARRVPFSGGSVSDPRFVLAPGEKASRLLRFDVGFLSTLTGKSNATVSYESAGVHRILLRLEGTHAASAPSMILKAAKTQLTTHVGYWRDLPIYRYAVIAVFLGAVCLLLSIGRGMLVVSVEMMRRLFSATMQTMSRVGRRGLQFLSGAFAAEPNDAAPSRRMGIPTLDVLDRSAHRILAPIQIGATELAPLFKKYVGGAHRAISRAASVPRRKLSDRLLADAQPVSVHTCVDRFRQLSYALNSGDGAPDTRALKSRDIRTEASRLARRFNADLKKGHLTPTLEHFQILWSLRLLVAVLDKTDADPRMVLAQWISGAEKVVEHGCQVGVGPTNSEFMELARELQD